MNGMTTFPTNNQQNWSTAAQWGQPPQVAPQMSVAPPDVAPGVMAGVSPLAYTGTNGQMANIGGMGANAPPLGYDMSLAGSDITSQFPAVGGESSWLDTMKSWVPGGFLGSKDPTTGLQTQGWGGIALGGLQGAANLFMGMKQYGLAKDQLAQSQKQFDINYGAQKQMNNTRLEDRQKARTASSSTGAYESVDSYMAKNGLK